MPAVARRFFRETIRLQTTFLPTTFSANWICSRKKTHNHLLTNYSFLLTLVQFLFTNRYFHSRTLFKTLNTPKISKYSQLESFLTHDKARFLRFLIVKEARIHTWHHFSLDHYAWDLRTYRIMSTNQSVHYLQRWISIPSVNLEYFKNLPFLKVII